ncbi:LptF/LptG family permease [Stratiformator vulcanicus]|uniref:Putative permease YjgP/YjgQ family protein n=1 Tax=Stratiformator vulcanicus TaxID=2527980 RepID=A0A517R2G1_9PLAN|nr:LptF/LptG family permease [Stratiformator vulcanicus]QDT38033.1 putative permease YjgP/YjgQ family protein [Stratiformator vulcanicus]
MRLLQRHILFELLKTFAVLLSILTVLLVFVGVFREVQESGLGGEQVLQILPFIVPSTMPFTIPATMLLTVCLVYGRIAANQEVTAAKAAGINVISLLAPAFVLAFLLSFASLILTDQVMPWAVENIHRIVANAVEEIFLDVLRSRHQMTDPQRGISITVMGVEDKRLIRPTFRYAPQGRSPVLIQAEEAELHFDVKNKQVLVELVHGFLDMPGDRQAWFNRRTQPFPLPEQMQVTKARHLSIRTINERVGIVTAELKQLRAERAFDSAFGLTVGEVERLSNANYLHFENVHETPRVTEREQLLTEKHSRFALAASCFFFVLMGAPYSIMQARKHFLTVFIICFVPILLGYYPMMLGLMNMAKRGEIDPTWSVWVANLTLLLISIWMIRRVLRN